MKKKFASDWFKTMALFGLMLAAIPASAHVSAMHSVNGFEAGFLHPLMGLDHLLAMLAVGMWAAQHQRSAAWLLPVVFPVMMVVGAVFGIAGVLIPGIEVGIQAGIAVSVLILGLLIATSVRLALPFGVSMIAVFAMAHGYAHGVELPRGAGAITFGLGFVLSTCLLHAIGVALSIAANRSLHTRFVRFAGAAIAMFGLFFVSSIA